MADWTKNLQSFNHNLVERYKSVDNAYTTTGAKTVTISPSPGLRSGYFRFRAKSVNASTTLQFKVTASDGSTTETLLNNETASDAGDVVHRMLPFHLDIAATSFVFVATVAGNGNVTLDYEVAGSR